MPPIAAIATILSLALLLISNVISGVYALPRNERPLSAQRSVGPCEASRLMDQPNPLQPRSIVMDQTIASFEEQGLCFHYFAERPSWHPDPCIEYCKNHGGHGYDGVSTAFMRYVHHLPLKPDLTKTHSAMLRLTLMLTSSMVIRALSRPMTTVSDGSLPLANAQIRTSRK